MSSIKNLNITKEELLNFLSISNVKCRSKELYKEVTTSIEDCQDCSHYEHCVIWKDENFLKFNEEHKYCERCKDQREVLNKGYIYICWKLQKVGLLPEQFQFQCCSCHRLED